MSARIFLLPTSAERLGVAAQRFQRMGYALNSTGRGRIEAKPKKRARIVDGFFEWVLSEERKS